MNERYGDNDDYPHLLESEIRSLASLAIKKGKMQSVNDLDIQKLDYPRPHSFLFVMKAQEIDVKWRFRPGDDSEIITGISIEYNEPRAITPGDIFMDSWVAVLAYSKVYDNVAAAVIDKQVKYHLSLTPGSESEAVEERSGDDRRSDFLNDDRQEALQELVNAPRPLNDDDVQFLRLLISQL